MKIVRRAVDAATRPMNLVAPGVGTLAAGGLVAMGMPPLALAIGALSLSAWGAMVAWDLASPAPAKPPPERRPPEIDSVELKRLLTAVYRAAWNVRRQVDEHEGVLSSSLLELRAECEGLLDSADETALRGDTLYAWLRSHDPNAIHQEARDRADAAHRARDVEVARSLRTAADAKARQLETYRELRALLDRISAELVAAEATLDELHARVMKLTLSDPGDAVARLSVGQDLAELRKRLQVLEKSAAATLREVG